MRIQCLFVIFFVGFVWCVDPQIVIIDTNAWSEPINLFDHVIKDYQQKHPTEGKLTYENVWKMFNGADSVDSVLSGYLNEKQLQTFSRGILFTKRILDLKQNLPEVEIDVPIFVYNELTKSLTSKIASESQAGTQLNYDIFFDLMPIKTNVERGDLVEGVDYPKKKPGVKDEKVLKEAMNDFFKENGIDGNQNAEGKHQSLNDLIHQLGLDVDRKKGETRKRLEKLKEFSENIRDKKQIWDSELKNLLTVSGFKDFTTESGRLFPVVTKIIGYADSMKNPKNKKQSSPIEAVIDRLLYSKEEFDIFDLKIYLYAKEKDAHIMTFNTQAFQEINDPTFLNFFEKIKILQPEINFKITTDLDHSLCETVLEAAIQNDFKREGEILSSLKTIKTVTQHEIDASDFHETFSNIIRECSENTAKLKQMLEEKPIFSALNMLKKEGGQWKIDQDIAFQADSPKTITENGRVFEFIEKEILRHELTTNDFAKGEPKIEKPPNLLKNQRIVEALRDGRTNFEGTLTTFLNVLKSKNKNDITAYGNVLHILTTYKPESIDEAIKKFANDPRKVPIKSCPGPSRRKRSVEPCALNWEDIDRINDEHEFSRDAEKAKINSDEFLKYLETVDDPLKRQQLYQFVEQLLETTEASETKITGASISEVNRVINGNKIVDHFSKVGQVAGAFNSGLFAKNILADFLSGDIKDVAVNLGFLAGDQALGKVAALAEIKGAAFVSSGKLMIGNTFRVAAPFIKRLSSALIVYDLVEQIKALESGDKDALIRVVGDGIILAADTFEAGVAIAELAGIAEISSVTGPIGLAIGAIVLVGTEVYFAVKHVKELDRVLHLSLDEKIIEGLNNVFHSPSVYLEELKEVKEANDKLVNDAFEFLKKQEHIQQFVFPAGKINYEKNRVDVSDSVKVRIADDRSKIRWDRSRPDDPAGGKVFCAMQFDIGEVPPADTTHMCIDAIGIADLTPKSDPCILFNLNQTSSQVEGFPDISNVFISGGKGVNLTGGNLNDIFSVKGDNDNTVTEINGLNGDDTLDLGDFIMDGPLEINFESGFCKLPCNIIMHNINRFLGRKKKREVITADCSTRYINGQAGMSARPDIINIAPKEDCRYNLSMQLDSNTYVRNDALLGDFTYFIEKNQDVVSVVAQPPLTEHQRLLNTTHTFYINYDIFDLEAVEYQSNKRSISVVLGFQNRDTNTRIPVSILLNTRNATIILRDMCAFNLHNNGLYGMQRTNKSVNEIMETYPELANRVNITFYIQSEQATVIVASRKTQENIFHNDPERETFIIANHYNASNVFIIDTQANSNLSQVTIISADNQMNTLDLRSVAEGIRKLHGNQCLLLHSIDRETNILKIELIEENTLTTKTIVWIKNFNFSSTHLHVILNNVPVILKYDENHLAQNINRQQILNDYIYSEHYTPLPLTFNATEIIVITPRDIEPNTQIIILQDLGEYTLTRFEDGLLVTNLIPVANSTSFIRNSCSVMLKEFYDRPDIFEFITLTFNDRTIWLDELTDELENAIEFNDWLKEFYNNRTVSAFR